MRMERIISTKSDKNNKEEITPEIIRDIIAKSLDDDKAIDVVLIDLAGKTSFADYMFIATGQASRHVSAMANHIMEDVKKAGGGNVKAEGMSQADWVLLDAGDVVVHLFRPEVREFYNLEKMWDVKLPNKDDSALA